MYRKLALLEHPDRIGRTEPPAMNCMGALSRALEQVQNYVAYEVITNGISEREFILRDEIVFSVS